jgi:hypothetical protein
MLSVTHPLHTSTGAPLKVRQTKPRAYLNFAKLNVALLAEVPCQCAAVIWWSYLPKILCGIPTRDEISTLRHCKRGQNKKCLHIWNSKKRLKSCLFLNKNLEVCIIWRISTTDFKFGVKKYPIYLYRDNNLFEKPKN